MIWSGGTGRRQIRWPVTQSTDPSSAQTISMTTQAQGAGTHRIEALAQDHWKPFLSHQSQGLSVLDYVACREPLRGEHDERDEITVLE